MSRNISSISKFKFERKPAVSDRPERIFPTKRRDIYEAKKLPKNEEYEWLSWSVFGYEILNFINVDDYQIEGYNLILRHNESNMFVEKMPSGCNLKNLLKKLEVVGKTYANNHISGFTCVAERTRIMPPHADADEFYKVGITVRSFVETNLKRIVKDMALSLLKFADEDGTSVVRNAKSNIPIVVEDDVVEDFGTEDVSMSIESQEEVPCNVQPVSPPGSVYKENKDNWALLIHSIPGKYMDLDNDWMRFLRMCLDVANTLGVSNREAMYQNCLKAMMTTKQIAHICPYQCIVRLPTGDHISVGECDLLIEFGNNRHYLVELKVCTQWRKYESQVKKYINACHSVGKQVAGAAIVNFNPKGVVEVIMFETNMRHSVSM
eukprot:549722-Hanusia_phi.AAC.6